MTNDALDIFPHSPFYPRALRKIYGELALPRLRAIGNLSLLGLPAVGFCGSRRASEKGLSAARELSTALAQEGIVVTSGYAKGVDTEAHLAALRAGGSTIIVLPEGISNFRIKKELRELWNYERILVLSQYDDVAVWRADRAMERNKIIVGASAATVVIEAGATGGTLDAGMTALKLGSPLFVAIYSDNLESNEGNRMLLRLGASKIGRSRDTGLVNISQILNVIN